MSDPLAEVIAMLNLRAVLTKTIEGAGDWRVRRSDQGLSFYGVVLEGGCRLEIDQHEPQILRAGETRLAHAIGIDEAGGLIVRYPDGTEGVVSSGEVSVRGMYGYV